MLELSIIVPLYNELENLEELIARIEGATADRNQETWEAIFVNDGSVDGTGRRMNELANEHPRFRMIHFEANQGQTAAMDAGIRAAKGTAFVTMDADLQNDPDDIELLLQHLNEDVDCVCGIRVKRNDNWIRCMSSRVANSIRNWISNENITDTGCSLKAFKKECFDNVKLFEGMHRFLPTLVKMQGFRVIEVPVRHHPRFAGESKYGIWNRLFKSFTDLLAVRWMKKRQLHYVITETPRDAANEA